MLCIAMDVRHFTMRPCTNLHGVRKDWRLSSSWLLVSKGVDHTKKKDGLGDLPIHKAAMNNNLPVLRYWIEDMHVNPDVQGFLDFTPLHLAAYNNHLDAIGYLAICANANSLAENEVSDRGECHVHVFDLSGCVTLTPLSPCSLNTLTGGKDAN